MNAPIDLPGGIAARLAERAFEPISHGESGAAVWRCTKEGSPALFLKTAPISADIHLGREAERLRWMTERDLPVAAVIEYAEIGDTEYLILDEVPGVPASDAQWASSIPQVVAALGKTLALFHRTDIGDCPFDQRIARQIEEARQRVASGQVREDDFDDERAGRPAAELLHELVSSVPEDEDLVLVHGDFCLPNIILQQSPDGRVQVAGLIDCSRAGVADRHQDLALAQRSIAYNMGSEWVRPFLDAYGSVQPDEDKLRFFTLLDEFF